MKDEIHDFFPFTVILRISSLNRTIVNELLHPEQILKSWQPENENQGFISSSLCNYGWNFQVIPIYKFDFFLINVMGDTTWEVRKQQFSSCGKKNFPCWRGQYEMLSFKLFSYFFCKAWLPSWTMAKNVHLVKINPLQTASAELYRKSGHTCTCFQFSQPTVQKLNQLFYPLNFKWCEKTFPAVLLYCYGPGSLVAAPLTVGTLPLISWQTPVAYKQMAAWYGHRCCES